MMVIIVKEENGGWRKIILPEPWKGEVVLPRDNPNPFTDVNTCGYESNSEATYVKCYLYKNGDMKELKGYVVAGRPIYTNTISKRKIFRDAEEELKAARVIAEAVGKPVVIQVNNVGPHIYEAPKITLIPAEHVANHYNLHIYKIELPRWLEEKLAEQENRAGDMLVIGKHIIYPAPYTPYLFTINTGIERQHTLEYAIVSAGSPYGGPASYTIVHPEHEKTTITLPPGYYLLVHSTVDGDYEEEGAVPGRVRILYKSPISGQALVEAWTEDYERKEILVPPHIAEALEKINWLGEITPGALKKLGFKKIVRNRGVSGPCESQWHIVLPEDALKIEIAGVKEAYYSPSQQKLFIDLEEEHYCDGPTGPCFFYTATYAYPAPGKYTIAHATPHCGPDGWVEEWQETIEVREEGE